MMLGGQLLGQHFRMTDSSNVPEPRLSLAQDRLRRFVGAPGRRATPVSAYRKRLLFVVAGALLGSVLVAVLGLWLLRPPEVAVLEIQRRSVEIVLSVVGRVRPKDLLDVRSLNAGQIVRLLHNDGDVVAAGAPLAIVRAEVEEAKTEAASARVTAARAEVIRTQLAFDRTRILADRGIASVVALEEARAALQSAEAALKVASAELRSAMARSGEFTILAPMAGVVLLRPIDNGQVISPETTLFQLGSRDAVEVRADVDETYADALRPGMSARASLSGSQAKFSARITEVSPRVDSTTGGRLIKLVPTESMRLPPGRSVDVTIVVARREDGIVVPRQAVIDATTEPKVYVVDQSGTVSARAITITDWPSLNAIVESGLADGELVVLAPAGTKPLASVRVRVQPSTLMPGL